jgi:Flavodoxin-like fold.
MNKILILFAHPRFEKSKTNRALLKNIGRLEGVTLNDLYEQYPDFNIDIDREKELLQADLTALAQLKKRICTSNKKSWEWHY